jgi:hypothetical protein
VSPYASLASSVESEAQKEGDAPQLYSLFGPHNLASEFDWMKLILTTTPGSAQTISSTNPSATDSTLLALKAVVLPSRVSEPTEIYLFSKPDNGFEVAGQTENGTNDINVFHILIYDSNNIPHDLIVGSATQNEVDSIIGSIHLE